MAHAKYTAILAERRAYIIAQLAGFVLEAEHHGYGLEELVRDARQRCKQLRDERDERDLWDASHPEY